MRKMGHGISIHPEPPLIHIYAPSFEFICDSHTRHMLVSAHCTISRLNKWLYLREYVVDKDRGFMGTTEPSIVQLMSEVSNDYQNGNHSGTSMGITMRHMDFLAKYGMAKFREQWTHDSERVSSTNTRATILIDDDDIDDDDNTFVVKN
jgi:hypothetical protein